MSTQISIADRSGGSNSPIQVPFSYRSVGPMIVQAAATLRIKSVVLLVTVPFDDGTSTASVGDQGDPSRLLGVAANSLGQSGVYEAAPYYLYPAPTDIKLYLNPGSSSQGSGILFLYEI